VPKSITLTTAIALAHERLYPRVAALLTQVERSAARHPEQPVPAATLAVAKTLFAEARKIIGREAMLVAGTATGSLSGLSIGLGQLKAGLEAFEAANSRFDAKLGRVAWSVAGDPLPVRRHKPAVSARPGPPQRRETPVDPGFRSKLIRRLSERENLRYLQGFRDGKAGRPPIPQIKDLDVIPED